MGGGIAQLAAMKGLDVILCDMHSAALERSIVTTNRSLSRLVGKQQLTQEQADSAASKIRRATDMQVSSNSLPPSTAMLQTLSHTAHNPPCMGSQDVNHQPEPALPISLTL